MAQTVTIQGATGTAKVRHPVAVPALALITLGIYGIYWWYQVNREMVDLGRARQVGGLGENPTLSALAYFPGGLVIVPAIFTLYNGVKRMQRAQEAVLGEVSLNGWIVFGLIAGSFVVGVLWIVVPGYIQSEMNKVWEREGAAQLGAEGAPLQQRAAPPPPARG